ncbi:MAG: hypothetical protein IJ467_00390 [Bacteroidaceae bacterium]|nr:hypothetical protein [Bacteroidaceae bacterium]
MFARTNYYADFCRRFTVGSIDSHRLLTPGECFTPLDKMKALMVFTRKKTRKEECSANSN